jgi:hypothetical protein
MPDMLRIGWYEILVIMCGGGLSCGCAAIPVATAGTLASIAATGVSTGSDLYKMGKLDTAELARVDEFVAAAHRAAYDLRLARTGYTTSPGITTIWFKDDRGANVKVIVERRTETLTRCRIDVGLYGSEVTARLFLARLRAHLPPPPLGPTTRPVGVHSDEADPLATPKS